MHLLPKTGGRVKAFILGASFTSVVRFTMLLMVEQSTLIAGNARNEGHHDGLAGDAEPVDPPAG